MHSALLRRHAHSHITRPLRGVKLFVCWHIYNDTPETIVDKPFHIKSLSAIGSRPWRLIMQRRCPLLERIHPFSPQLSAFEPLLCLQVQHTETDSQHDQMPQLICTGDPHHAYYDLIQTFSRAATTTTCQVRRRQGMYVYSTSAWFVAKPSFSAEHRCLPATRPLTVIFSVV